MAALNQLYDWDMLTRMMSQTVPRLEFDDYFTTQRLADLEKTYGWDGSFNEDRSVLYAHSGLINGNPFIICRTKKMEMGTKTYTGSKVIHWTTYERGAGITPSCGTAMTSSATAMALQGVCSYDCDITVENRGGVVRCLCSNTPALVTTLIGNATFTERGEVEFDGKSFAYTPQQTLSTEIDAWERFLKSR